MELLGIEMPLEEFDRLLVAQSNGKELKVVDGKVVAVDRIITEQEKAQTRIGELKAKLQETDYQAIKHFEGYLTDYEYEPIKAERQAWRDEINELEKLI